MEKTRSPQQDDLAQASHFSRFLRFFCGSRGVFHPFSGDFGGVGEIDPTLAVVVPVVLLTPYVNFAALRRKVSGRSLISSGQRPTYPPWGAE